MQMSILKYLTVETFAKVCAQQWKLSPTLMLHSTKYRQGVHKLYDSSSSQLDIT